MAVINSNNAQLTFSNLPVGIQVTIVTDTSADWPSVANSTYFYDKGDGLVHYKNSSGVVLELFSAAGGLTYFTEARSTAAPNATVPVDSLTAVSATTNADAAIVPKASGALLAAIPDGTATGGNKRGINALDLQMSRSSQVMVASGNFSAILGGANNMASGANSVVAGAGNSANGSLSFAIGHNNNSTNNNSYSFGNENLSNGVGSYSIGRYNNASGSSAVAIGGSIGNYNTASGTRSVSIGEANTASGTNSSISGGICNIASGACSNVNGGRSNTSSSLYAAISGGFKNLSQGIAGFIGGGNCNSICNSTSGCLAFGAVVAGGVGNNTVGGTWTLASCAFTVAPTICNAGIYSTVGGGFQNKARGESSVIAGGFCNTSSVSIGTTIGGGACNTTSSVYSTVAGGLRNSATNNWATIGGGVNHTVSNQYSTVAGGFQNTASGLSSSVIGGRSNTASGNGAVAGGCSNSASGNNGVALGLSNTVSGLYSVGLGWANQATGQYVVALGYSNCASGSGSFSAGSQNTANASSAVATGTFSNVFGVIGRNSHSSGAIAVTGDAQYSKWVLKIRTTDATATNVTTNAGAVSGTNELLLQNNNSFNYKGTIIGKQSGSTNIASWNIDGLAVRGATAATTTLVINNINLVSNAPGWGTPTVAANTTFGELQIQVIGAVGTNIQWVATIETTEVIYA